MAGAVDPEDPTRCIANKAGPWAFPQRGSSDESSSNATATLEARRHASSDESSSNLAATLEVEAPPRATPRKLARRGSSKWIDVSARARPLARHGSAIAEAELPEAKQEKVPAKCLSELTSDKIVRRLREKDKSWSGPFLKLNLNAVFLTPLPAIIIFCLLPWASPFCYPVWEYGLQNLILMESLSIIANYGVGWFVVLVFCGLPYGVQFFKLLTLLIVVDVLVLSTTLGLIAVYYASPVPFLIRLVAEIIGLLVAAVFSTHYLFGIRNCLRDRKIRRRALVYINFEIRSLLFILRSLFRVQLPLHPSWHDVPGRPTDLLVPERCVGSVDADQASR